MDVAGICLGGAVGACLGTAAYALVGGRGQDPAAVAVGRDPLGQFLGSLGHRLERWVPQLAELRRRAERARRAEEGLRQLPEMLDILTLGLSAGLSFDASLELYCDRSETGLSRAFRGAMQSWRMGVTTRDAALRALADELSLAALQRFADAVSQALAFGSPLAAVLEQQSQAIRDEQRAQVEEQIEQVPVKMLIPLGTLIVPAMLLAILGPLLGASLSIG